MGRTVACLRVCADAQQGCRRYMEDFVDLRYEKDKNGNTIAFFAVFDGHGGKEAALFARNRLWTNLRRRPTFYSESPEKVCKTISDVFLETHESMWPHREKWPMTESGYVSTSGCTASVVIIKGSDVFVAHVGDSSVVLAEKKEAPTPEEPLHANMLTQDHQPQYMQERNRIKKCGGTVEIKKGVSRVVWRRPSFPGQVATRNNSRYTNVPFLSVSRALGDLWSWNEEKREYIVSPTPDVLHFKLDLDRHKFLVVASDGVWNVFPPKLVTKTILQLDLENVGNTYNVAEKLVTNVICRCQMAGVRSDNTSAIIIFFEDKEELTGIPSERREDSVVNQGVYADESDEEEEKEAEMFFDSNQEMDENVENAMILPIPIEAKPLCKAINAVNNENTNPSEPKLTKLPESMTSSQPLAQSQPVIVALNEQTNVVAVPHAKLSAQLKSSLNASNIAPALVVHQSTVKSGQKRRPESDACDEEGELHLEQPSPKVSKTEVKTETAGEMKEVNVNEDAPTEAASKEPQQNCESSKQESTNISDRSSFTHDEESKTQGEHVAESPSGETDGDLEVETNSSEKPEKNSTDVKQSQNNPNSFMVQNIEAERNSAKGETSEVSNIIANVTEPADISRNAVKSPRDPIATTNENTVKTSPNQDMVRNETAVTTCTTYKVVASKPKGPPSPGQKRVIDSNIDSDDSFSTEHENLDPINCDLVDLHSAHVTGCNIQTTLVLEISDNKRKKVECNVTRPEIASI